MWVGCPMVRRNSRVWSMWKVRGRGVSSLGILQDEKNMLVEGHVWNLSVCLALPKLHWYVHLKSLAPLEWLPSSWHSPQPLLLSPPSSSTQTWQ